MIIKIKTFSGETLYLPEEDYLDKVMYNENLEERGFARRDYDGLTPQQAVKLRAIRNEIAKFLNKTRNSVDLDSRALYGDNGSKMSSEVKRRSYRNCGYGYTQFRAQDAAQKARQAVRKFIK